MSETMIPLRDLIEERTGLYFRDFQGLGFLSHRLESRLEPTGCASFTDYHQLLINPGAPADNEWREVIALLSKPVSSFYRHEEMVRVLADVIMPRLYQRNLATIKIWCAACATGEEPLMIAMALADAGWFDRIAIEIHASDANFAALEKAVRGVYVQRRIDTLDAELRSNYFLPEADEWRVAPELHERIDWSVVNLMDETAIAELAVAEIVFCRHVFIYFSDTAVKQTLAYFAKYMPSGSYLFADTGDHFQALMREFAGFERQEMGDGSVWLKL